MTLAPRTYIIGIVEGENNLSAVYTSTPFEVGSAWVYADGTRYNIGEWGYKHTYVIDAIFGDLIIGVPSIESNNNVSVYPNPATGIVNINGANNADIRIFNVTGSLVADFSNYSGNQLDLSSMGTGIYFIKVFSHENVITRKLVIE